MSLSTAQSLAWNLAKTLMTVTVLIEITGGYAVMPSDEFWTARDDWSGCVVS